MTNYSKNGIEVDGSLIVVIDDFLTTGKYDGTILPNDFAFSPEDGVWCWLLMN